MSTELIIDSSNGSDVQIALLKDGRLHELQKEVEGRQFQVGDIYLGKVKKTVPGLNAAFVDVGYENIAFFRRLFKRNTGLSPGEYRRMFQPFLSG